MKCCFTWRHDYHTGFLGDTFRVVYDSYCIPKEEIIYALHCFGIFGEFAVV